MDVPKHVLDSPKNVALFCHAFVKLKFYRLPTTRRVFLSSFTVYRHEKRDGFWCVKTFIHTAFFFLLDSENKEAHL